MQIKLKMFKKIRQTSVDAVPRCGREESGTQQASAFMGAIETTILNAIYTSKQSN